ncbi:hypothetical protein THAOC_02983, partial [Thalassiosira oceanica]
MCELARAGGLGGQKGLRGIFVLLLMCCFSRTTMAINDYVPARYKIPARQSECIYRQFPDRDMASFSVFVLEALDNGRPLAKVTFEGPVALMNRDLLPRSPSKNGPDEKSSSSREVLGRDIFKSILNDWPKIGNPAHAPVGVLLRTFKVDWTHAGESEDAALCVAPDSAPLIVEMDIRSANEMRGVDPGTGHVWTHQRRQFMDEQAALDTIDEEAELSDEDFTEAKVKLKYMHD